MVEGWVEAEAEAEKPTIGLQFLQEEMMLREGAFEGQPEKAEGGMGVGSATWEWQGAMVVEG